MQGKNEQVEGMYESCRMMWERARRTVWEASGSGSGLLANTRPMQLTPTISAGKGTEEKESIEDFIKRIESIAGGSENAEFEFEYVN